MSKKIDTSEMWRLLREDTKTPKPQPEVSTIGKLKVQDISTAVGVFQPRRLDGAISHSEDHLKVLSRVLSDKRELDPIKVWWSGQRWYVIDGHHRLLSYKMAKKEWIPTEVLTGNLEGMLIEACEENSKNRLPMSQEDKSTMAWRMVCLTIHSKKQIARAGGASVRNVGYMRRAKADLLKKGYMIESLANLRWWQVKQYMLESEPEDLDPEEKLKADIDKLVKRFRKQFSGSLSKVPEVLAGALVAYDADLPLKLVKSESWKRANARHRLMIHGNSQEFANFEKQRLPMTEDFKECLGVKHPEDFGDNEDLF